MPKTVDDLLELAHSLNLEDGALDDELFDTCNSVANKLFKKISGGILYDQIEFLLQNGYDPGRLAEIIEEIANET